MYRRNADPIAHAYDADMHCPDCAFARFGVSVSDGSAVDQEGNPLGPVFDCDGDTDNAQHCADCGEYLYGQTRDLLISDHHGIYLPKAFANERGAAWGMSEDAIEILRAGPDHESYWDTWSDVLDTAEAINSDGKVWRLEQDGDLFAVYSGEKRTEREIYIQHLQEVIAEGEAAEGEKEAAK